MRTDAPLLFVALAACGGSAETDDDPWEALPVPADADGDGWAADGGDCDDADAAVHPGRTEVCDGADDDCDGAVDEQTADADGDGTCDARDVEDCNGADDDGDGAVDEGFPDGDGDGTPDCVAVEACDGDDDDGDGEVDEGFDADDDGVTACGGDCDDDDDARAPGLAEVSADGVDQDCDGTVDEDDWSAGDLAITEVLADPAAVPDAVGEWFEVRNATDRALSLEGLAVDDGTRSWRIPAAPPLAPGAYAVLAASADPSRNGGVRPLAAWGTGLSLPNAGGGLAVRVARSDGPLTIAETAWERAPGGASLAADADGWCASGADWAPLTDHGSPGAANPPCAADGDGDGFSTDAGDCDDARPDVFPGAPETDAAVDQDCDGVAERGPDVTLAVSPASADDTCGEARVEATVAPDPDAPIAVSWELVPPPGSALDGADLDVVGSAATFTPDVPGDWTVRAWARDAGDALGVDDVATLAIAAGVSGEPPVAESGANVFLEGTTTCQDGVCAPCDEQVALLDGGASDDPEGGPLAWEWRVVSGWALVAAPRAEVTSVRVAGPVPAPGEEAVRTVFVALRVADCGGAWSAADVVAITYTCAAP